MRVLILLAIVATASMLGSSVTSANVDEIITESLFNEMLKHRNDDVCPAKNFYTYGAFIEAANSLPGFGTTGDLPTRNRELAAFFGQTSQETTGRGPSQPYEWGYCFKEEADPNNRYHGRGPIQLTGDYNYGPAGEAIKVDLINNPDLITSDPVIAFKSAIWFWMTPQQPKPSIHDVMIGQWVPSDADTAARRVPGYGVVTNIINGGIECGKGNNDADNNRQEYFKRYCGILGVEPGTNLGCGDQTPFNQ